MTVYRRPDPIPLRRDRPLAAATPMSAIRPEQDDLHHLVARQIFGAILSGQFPEGSILPNELSLSRDLRVSRTALREAIKGLASKGLLESRRRRGTLVLDRSLWNLLDADLIAWSRRIRPDGVSSELWAAVTTVLPGLMANAAACRASGRLQLLANGLSDAEAELPARIDFLLEIARLGDNRFLLSLVSAALRNLLHDDPAFLRTRTESIMAPDAGELARLIAKGQATTATAMLDTMLAARERVTALNS